MQKNIKYPLKKIKKKMKDPLGDRIKAKYENITRSYIPKKTNGIIRLDGKAFHTYAKGLDKPYDEKLIYAMDEAAKHVISKVQGAKFGFVQSDEISIIFTDYDNINSQMYFNGNIQKITSITAAECTHRFNAVRREQGYTSNYGVFDSRVFSIPTQIEAYNYFLWRQQDCIRNSKLTLAQTHLGKNQCHGFCTNDLVNKLNNNGIFWSEQKNGHKYGRFIIKEYYEKNGATRSRWVAVDATPLEKEYFLNILPKDI